MKIALNQHVNIIKDLSPTQILQFPIMASVLVVSLSKDSDFSAGDSSTKKETV